MKESSLRPKGCVPSHLGKHRRASRGLHAWLPPCSALADQILWLNLSLITRTRCRACILLEAGFRSLPAAQLFRQANAILQWELGVPSPSGYYGACHPQSLCSRVSLSHGPACGTLCPWALSVVNKLLLVSCVLCPVLQA